MKRGFFNYARFCLSYCLFLVFRLIFTITCYESICTVTWGYPVSNWTGGRYLFIFKYNRKRHFWVHNRSTWSIHDSCSRLFASALSLFLYSLATDPISLLGVRFVHGFMEGLIVPAAFTFLANRAEESKRGKSVAISGAFVGLAAILGPAYGGIVAAKTSTPFIMAVNGGIMLLIAISAFFILRSYTSCTKTIY